MEGTANYVARVVGGLAPPPPRLVCAHRAAPN